MRMSRDLRSSNLLLYTTALKIVVFSDGLQSSKVVLQYQVYI